MDTLTIVVWPHVNGNGVFYRCDIRGEGIYHVRFFNTKIEATKLASRVYCVARRSGKFTAINLAYKWISAEDMRNANR